MPPVAHVTLAVITKKIKMNFSKINTELKSTNLFMKPIAESDRGFITEMFQDIKICRYYIVPKEAQQDYKRLIGYWLNDVKNGAGTCWIIYKKATGFFTKDKPCGFVAFEFRDTLKNARISYAVLPNYRKLGIASESVSILIKHLKENGIERIEADIDQDNKESAKVVEKQGFIANKRKALVDPEMMRDGEIRLRFLWVKELAEQNLKTSNDRIPTNANLDLLIPRINQVVNEIDRNGQQPKLLAQYFHLLGRIKFLEGDFEQAKQSFGQSNMISMSEGMPENHENFYWFGRINDAKGEKDDAKIYYEFALEKYKNNPSLISKEEIVRKMNE
jgi:RimJ/RimL family protein N-acetyltransferase